MSSEEELIGLLGDLINSPPESPPECRRCGQSLIHNPSYNWFIIDECSTCIIYNYPQNFYLDPNEPPSISECMNHEISEYMNHMHPDTSYSSDEEDDDEEINLDEYGASDNDDDENTMMDTQ